MQKRTQVLMLASLLAATPLALAHDLFPGTPKTYCESGSAEAAVHDYGPPATRVYLGPPVDGNLADCNGDGDLADHDGHDEFAPGGAWLSVDTDGEPSYGGGGALYCLGEVGHHPAFPVVTVWDAVVGSTAHFLISVDLVDLHPPLFGGPSCGDFQDDHWHYEDCMGSCVPTFPPGLDGAYHVCVEGYLGHVSTEATGAAPASAARPIPAADPVAGPTTGVGCGPVTDTVPDPGEVLPYTPECMDRWDNDYDGSIDWTHDAECNSPLDDTEQS